MFKFILNLFFFFIEFKKNLLWSHWNICNLPHLIFGLVIIKKTSIRREMITNGEPFTWKGWGIVESDQGWQGDSKQVEPDKKCPNKVELTGLEHVLQHRMVVWPCSYSSTSVSWLFSKTKNCRPTSKIMAGCVISHQLGWDRCTTTAPWQRKWNTLIGV
jgi:hypothetical protein